MKKIALITDGIWPYVLGGMQKHSYYLCKYLAKEGIYIDLFHFNASDLNIDALEYFTEEEKHYIHSIVLDFPTKAKSFGNYIRNSFSYSKLVYSVIHPKLNDYDFIYTKGFTGWKLINEKFQKKIDCCKIGINFHGYEMFQRAPSFKLKAQQILLLRKPVKKLSQRADIVFSYGGKITDIILNLGVQPSKIIEVAAGLEENDILSEIRATHFPVKFLYLGRYERRKGIEELNQALSLINKEIQFEFHFIGPIPSDKRLIDKRIVYHNEIRDKHTLELLIANCDVLVCPSWSEGMPNVILEGMSKGLAILASDVGATSLIVDNSNGWILNEITPQNIKSKLLEINKIPAHQLNELKKNSLLKITSRFTWEKLIKDLINKLKNY